MYDSESIELDMICSNFILLLAQFETRAGFLSSVRTDNFSDQVLSLTGFLSARPLVGPLLMKQNVVSMPTRKSRGQKSREEAKSPSPIRVAIIAHVNARILTQR